MYPYLVSVFLLFFISCDKFVVNKEEVIARVGAIYLYRTDLEKRLDAFVNEADSILKSRNYIDQWARNQIIMQQAEINLDIEEVQQCSREFNLANGARQ